MATTDAILRFDHFELDLAERRLLRDGEFVPLGAKAFDLLAALVQRSGRLVTKNELLDLVWPGMVVEENNIAAQVVALRKALDNDLIVTVPGQGYRFTVRPVAEPASARPAAPSVPASALPARQLFGRERDLTRLHAALSVSGCVTLVGPGGVGKTSLAQALRVATPSPTFWVDLAALRAGDQLLPALCRGTGLSIAAGDAMPALATALSGARLIVLDNAEHLVDEVAALVPALLAIAPRLRVLVTSQVPLAIEGERLERIDPLEVPAPELHDAQAQAVGAVALFLDRVRAADSRFCIAPAAWPQVRELCRQLDGLPLALEMAAARVPLLGVRHVLEALSERFAVLRHGPRDVPDRQRSLQAALDWSYQLLSPDEQQLFRALGVFSGGFTLELAVAVADDHDRWDTIDRLALLVDRSLVAIDHDDPPRYRLLETMRSYALAGLRPAGEEQAVRARQGAAIEALFQDIHDLPRAPAHEPRRQLALDEMENAREVLDWARRHDPALAVRLSAYVSSEASLWPWRAEAFSWLSACEPLLAPGFDIEPRWQALWWRNRAAHSFAVSELHAAEHARRAVEVCRATGEPLHLAYSLMYLSLAMSRPGPESGAADEAQALMDAHPDWSDELRVYLLNTKALACMKCGDLEASAALLRSALELAVREHLPTAKRYTVLNLADVLRQSGRQPEALDLLVWGVSAVEAPMGLMAQRCELLRLRILFELGRFEEAQYDSVPALATGRRFAMLATGEVLALGMAQAGRLRMAALLIGRTRQAYADRGALLDEGPQADIPRATSLVWAGLGTANFERLVERGRLLDDGETEQLLRAGDAAVE
jgi:predicted ATPase/DNA-binding winged helix-turn-helix (wHTH) protein